LCFQDSFQKKTDGLSKCYYAFNLERMRVNQIIFCC
jgi:hypothetical protein